MMRVPEFSCCRHQVPDFFFRSQGVHTGLQRRRGRNAKLLARHVEGKVRWATGDAQQGQVGRISLIMTISYDISRCGRDTFLCAKLQCASDAGTRRCERDGPVQTSYELLTLVYYYLLGKKTPEDAVFRSRHRGIPSSTSQ